MCEVMHFGRSNKPMTYTMNGDVLGSVENKDLSILGQGSMKLAAQIDSVEDTYLHTGGGGRL